MADRGISDRAWLVDLVVYFANANDTFTRAIDDLRTDWQAHRARFLREVER